MPARLYILLLLAALFAARPAGASVPLSMPVNELADPQAASQVGIDERLGEKIPLDLSFRDESGKTVSLRSLVAGPTVIVPIYFSCPNVCSFLQGALARTLPEVRRKPGEEYRVLSISFDETETPADARRAKAIYYQAMDHRFPPDAWHFLTGDKPAIDKLLNAAGYHFLREKKDFLHPVAIFIVTGDGKITRYLYGTSILPMDLTLALVESAEGRVSPAIRKMAQFCFSYDPKNGKYVFNIFRVSATVVLLTAAGLLTFLIFTGRKKRES